MELPAGTKIRFKTVVEQDGIIFAQPDTEGIILKSGACYGCDDDFVVKANDSDMEFMSGFDEFDVVVETPEPAVYELSRAAKLADQVFQFATFSGKCDDMKASEIRALLLPIFGEEVMTELVDHYKK